MRSDTSKAPIGAMLCMMLILLPVQGADAALGKIAPQRGTSRVNGAPVSMETTVFSGDQLSTESDGTAMLVVPGGGQVHFGPSSMATVVGSENDIAVEMDSGVARLRVPNGQSLSVNAHGLVIQAASGVSFEVGIDSGAVLVAARNGNVEVVGTNTSLTIPAGSVMRFETVSMAELNKATDDDERRAFIWTPANAVWVAVLVSVGIAIPVGYFLADQLADDAAAEGCRRAIRAISPSIPLTVCDVPS